MLSGVTYRYKPICDNIWHMHVDKAIGMHKDAALSFNIEHLLESKQREMSSNLQAPFAHNINSAFKNVASNLRVDGGHRMVSDPVDPLVRLSGSSATHQRSCGQCQNSRQFPKDSGGGEFCSECIQSSCHVQDHLLNSMTCDAMSSQCMAAMDTTSVQCLSSMSNTSSGNVSQAAGASHQPGSWSLLGTMPHTSNHQPHATRTSHSRQQYGVKFHNSFMQSDHFSNLSNRSISSLANIANRYSGFSNFYSPMPHSHVGGHITSSRMEAGAGVTDSSFPWTPTCGTGFLASSYHDHGLYLPPYRKPKRVRTAFAPTQLLRLEHAFEKNHYVIGHERKELSASLNLSETQVKVWFQNRRTKHKRTQSEEEMTSSLSRTDGQNS